MTRAFDGTAAAGGAPGVRRDQSAHVAGGLDGYFRRSELPLYSLAFLLPLVIAYEVGITFHAAQPIAFRLIHQCFSRIGMSGRFVPALTVAGILITWHIARNDTWRIRTGTLLGMILESVLLALPLVALSTAMSRWQVRLPLIGHAASSPAWGNVRDLSVLSLGAGIYEELVFRLVLMTLLSVVLIDVLRMPKQLGSVLIVLTSGVLFSLYHYLGSEPFTLRSFAFRTLAGIYFGVLFVTRGFGVTAGSHAFYDLMIVTLRLCQ